MVGSLIMTSKSIARSLVRRQYLWKANISALNSSAGNLQPGKSFERRRMPAKWPQLSIVPTRALSTSIPNRYATVEESLDFREQDRESDEVDVCIVGGGNDLVCNLLASTDISTFRPRWIERSDQT